MLDTKLLDKLCKVLQVPDGSLTGREELSSLENWNSLAVLGFMAVIDEHYGVILSPERVLACKTVNDLLDLAVPHVTG
jgi:acyl carrier protein